MLKKIGLSIWELVKFVAIVLVIVVPIRMFIAQPFIVSGASMVPTFHNSEYLIIDELSYRFRDPERGDVIVFRYPIDPSKYFIKRVIGLPGETIEVRNNEVWIHYNGQNTRIEEPYISGEYWADTTLTLGQGEYFVMGDNRMVSHDSRAWGALPEKYITGRAFIRLFPPNRLNLFPGTVN